MRVDFTCSSELQEFQEAGFLGPYPLIESQMLHSICTLIKRDRYQLYFWEQILRRSPYIKHKFVNRWGKARWRRGLHVVSPSVYTLATAPRIVELVKSILGSDLILCASRVVVKKGGQNTDWHIDAEHLQWRGVTVWICLEAIEKDTSVDVILGSHRLPYYPAELEHQHHLNPGSDHAVVEAAQLLDRRCQLLSLSAKPGEMILFSGRLWHAVKNQFQKTRRAIVFQYAPTSSAIKIPEDASRFPIVWTSRSAPCCLISGTDNYHHNLIISPP